MGLNNMHKEDLSLVQFLQTLDLDVDLTRERDTGRDLDFEISNYQSDIPNNKD